MLEIILQGFEKEVNEKFEQLAGEISLDGTEELAGYTLVVGIDGGVEKLCLEMGWKQKGGFFTPVGRSECINSIIRGGVRARQLGA